jgi:pimeloyl-ACP methyl ester carboxylesterase
MLFFYRLIAFFFVILYFSSCKTDNEKSTDTDKKNPIVHANPDSLDLADTLNKPYKKGDKLTYEQAYDRSLTLFKTPFVEQYVKTRFGNAHVIISGPKNGKPLVLLHGMNASSTMWYPNIKSLSEHYRVYAIDCFLEPGKSQCIGEVSGMKDIISWYFEVFDQLHLTKFDLVGASRGGWLSVNIALHSGSRINKLVLLSPAQTFGIIKPGLDIFSNINYSINPKRENLRDVLETMSSNVDSISQIFINQYYLATTKAVIDSDIFKMQPFSHKELKSLTMPVLVLIGDNDIINGDLNLSRAKRLCCNVRTGTISHAGHFLSIDQPAVVNKKILDFLDKE